jgi:TolB-like protein/DNA-binding winged helix-turn-helix (wHTH) protein/Flp pilus assembly protein TadD
MPEVYRFEDFELEPDAYQLSFKGQAVRLERIPLQLLSLLVERRGQVVSRSEILESIWGKGVFIDSENAINTAVRKLRRALKDDADTPRFIVTIPAKGYRFVAPVLLSNGQSQINQHGHQPNKGNSADFHSSPAVSENPDAGGRRWRAPVLAAVSVAVCAGLIVAIIHLIRLAPLSLSRKMTAEVADSQLPNTLSIAVLPFTNLSGDPQQEYFSDGITDELIADLSRIAYLSVVAASSSFAYKGKTEPVQQVARDLGVKYVLEGSIRKFGSRLRIQVELVEATRGHQLWAHRYDKQLGDVFALQDEIVQSVVATLGVQFTMLRKGIVIPQLTNSVEAYDYFLRGIQQLVVTDSYPQAREMFAKAVVADPGYSDAYVYLALADLVDYFWQFGGAPDTPEHSEKLVRKSIALDESWSGAYAVLACALAFENRLPEALAMGRRAVALDGHDPMALSALSGILNMMRQPEEALTFAQKSLQVFHNAKDSIFEVGIAYNEMGSYRNALEAFKQSNPNNAWTHLGLIYSYTELGYRREARMEAREVMRVAPKFSLEEAQRRWPGLANDPGGRRFVDDLRKAGLK